MNILALKWYQEAWIMLACKKKGFFSNALNSFHICMSSVVWQHSGLVKSIEGWAPPCIILTRSPKISPSPDWTVRQPSATRLPIHLGFGKYWHSELLHSARTFAIFWRGQVWTNVEQWAFLFNFSPPWSPWYWSSIYSNCAKGTA